MSKYRLWIPAEPRCEGFGMLIEDSNVVQKVVTFGEAMLVEGIDPAEVEKLNALLEKNPPQSIYYDGMTEWLSENGYENAEVWNAPDFVDPEDGVLIFWQSPFHPHFEHLPDCWTFPTYEWWDGSNWRTEWLQDVDTEHRFVLGECLSLDEWDGQNWQTGGLGKHARVYRVVELDGEAPEEPTYLLERWSQWQGDHPIGRLYTADELSAMLEEVGRDPQEYLPKITALNE